MLGNEGNQGLVVVGFGNKYGRKIPSPKLMASCFLNKRGKERSLTGWLNDPLKTVYIAAQTMAPVGLVSGIVSVSPVLTEVIGLICPIYAMRCVGREF